MINRTMQKYRDGVTYPGRYITLRSVAKSVAVSEERIRGQPFGDSAAARLAWVNISRRMGEWSERMLVWTRKRVFAHNTSTFPSSKLKVLWGVTVVGSVRDSSLKASAMMKSDKLAMLIGGDWVTGGIISVSGPVTDSRGED